MSTPLRGRRATLPPTKLHYIIIKLVLHGATCNNEFTCNNVGNTLRVLTWVQKLAMCCRVKKCAKNRPRYHVIRYSIFRATVLRKKSLLQVVPGNSMK